MCIRDSIDDLIEEMLDHPGAYEMVNRVNKALKIEKENRLKFREWLKDDVKAEFINGEIVMHSPVKRGHLKVTENLFPLLQMYVVYQELGVVSVEKALVETTRNDYEPDICYWTKEQAANFNDDTMAHPPPALVVEILSKGTQNKDRGVKFDDYAAHGIPEYWIIDPKKKIVEQYLLNKEEKIYELFKKLTISKTLASKVLKGFKIPVKAIFDKKESLKTLRQLIE